MQRADVWRLAEQFTKRLRAGNLSTFRQVAADAARIARDQAAARRYRYQHVVVDEAQDLNSAHWLLLRSMVAAGANDMFLVGDTHQRIYDSYVSLGSLGVNIRGRSAKLTLSYRSTHQILATAEALLGRQAWDDLDDGTDDLAGYRSVLRGPRPVLRGYPTWAEELAAMTAQVKDWLTTDGASSVGVAVPTRRLRDEAARHLSDQGISVTTLGNDGPRQPGAAVHVGTLHRFKGLEYQRMLVAGASAGLIPDARIAGHRESDPVRYEHDLKQARALLFVAATRARDALTITWHGTPSPFLPPSAR